MNKAYPATAKTAQIEKDFRRADWVIATEPFSRPAGSAPAHRYNDLRLKAALQRAVKRDLAPRALIDLIRDRIRNTDEPR
jgi:hypothetical protein